MVKISLDLDGVLVDFSTVAVKLIREMYLPDLPLDYEHQMWSFADIITEEQWMTVFRRMLATENLWHEELPAFQENVDALKEYIARNGEDGVCFLTSRPDCAGGSAKTMTGLWLWDQGLPIRNLIMAPRHGDKATLVVEHGISYSLDDYAPTVTACQHLGAHRAFVLDRPYNRGQADPIGLPRVYSVAEFLLEVETHEA